MIESQMGRDFFIRSEATMGIISLDYLLFTVLGCELNELSMWFDMPVSEIILATLISKQQQTPAASQGQTQ